MLYWIIGRDLKARAHKKNAFQDSDRTAAFTGPYTCRDSPADVETHAETSVLGTKTDSEDLLELVRMDAGTVVMHSDTRPKPVFP